MPTSDGPERRRSRRGRAIARRDELKSNQRRAFSPSPRLRGRDERSSLLEGRGEGDSRQTQWWRVPHTRNSLHANFDLSPQAGRGDLSAGAYALAAEGPPRGQRLGASPSFLMRDSSVVGLMSSRAAAPFDPRMRQLHCSTACRMMVRSASSSEPAVAVRATGRNVV
jgi:hypothetical protein